MFKINLNDSMLYFGLYVQLRRGSVAGYTTDESWAYGPKEGVEAFESITFFIRFIYAINFEHLFIKKLLLPFFFIPAASCLCFFFTTFAVMAFPNRRMLTKPTGVFNRWTILEE